MLTIEDIQARLQRQTLSPFQPPVGIRWRRAAVLLPLIWLEEEWHLLYILRTQHVAEHKGQVAFPGGAADAEDGSIEDTALREAWEEIGLDPGGVQVLGRLPDFFTITNYLITPVVGVISWPYEVKISQDEVEKVFLIPLRWLADSANMEERRFTRPGGVEEQVIFYKIFHDELLWGATARITVIFLQALGLID